MKPIDIAIVCHEINAAYCATIGDNSQPSWWNAPQWQRDSAEAGVKIHLANPSLTPKESHDSWLAHKLADGWSCGPVKDAALKQHPSMVDYEQLPAEVRTKDVLFKTIVNQLSHFVVNIEGTDGIQNQAATQAVAGEAGSV